MLALLTFGDKEAEDVAIKAFRMFYGKYVEDNSSSWKREEISTVLREVFGRLKNTTVRQISKLVEFGSAHKDVISIRVKDIIDYLTPFASQEASENAFYELGVEAYRRDLQSRMNPEEALHCKALFSLICGEIASFMKTHHCSSSDSRVLARALIANLKNEDWRTIISDENKDRTSPMDNDWIRISQALNRKDPNEVFSVLEDVFSGAIERRLIDRAKEAFSTLAILTFDDKEAENVTIEAFRMFHRKYVESDSMPWKLDEISKVFFKISTMLENAFIGSIIMRQICKLVEFGCGEKDIVSKRIEDVIDYLTPFARQEASGNDFDKLSPDACFENLQDRMDRKEASRCLAILSNIYGEITGFMRANGYEVNSRVFARALIANLRDEDWRTIVSSENNDSTSPMKEEKRDRTSPMDDDWTKISQALDGDDSNIVFTMLEDGFRLAIEQHLLTKLRSVFSTLALLTFGDKEAESVAIEAFRMFYKKHIESNSSPWEIIKISSAFIQVCDMFETTIARQVSKLTEFGAGDKDIVSRRIQDVIDYLTPFASQEASGNDFDSITENAYRKNLQSRMDLEEAFHCATILSVVCVEIASFTDAHDYEISDSRVLARALIANLENEDWRTIVSSENTDSTSPMQEEITEAPLFSTLSLDRAEFDEMLPFVNDWYPHVAPKSREGRLLHYIRSLDFESDNKLLAILYATYETRLRESTNRAQEIRGAELVTLATNWHDLINEYVEYAAFMQVAQEVYARYDTVRGKMIVIQDIVANRLEPIQKANRGVLDKAMTIPYHNKHKAKPKFYRWIKGTPPSIISMTIQPRNPRIAGASSAELAKPLGERTELMSLVCEEVDAFCATKPHGLQDVVTITGKDISDTLKNRLLLHRVNLHDAIVARYPDLIIERYSIGKERTLARWMFEKKDPGRWSNIKDQEDAKAALMEFFDPAPRAALKREALVTAGLLREEDLPRDIDLITAPTQLKVAHIIRQYEDGRAQPYVPGFDYLYHKIYNSNLQRLVKSMLAKKTLSGLTDEQLIEKINAARMRFEKKEAEAVARGKKDKPDLFTPTELSRLDPGLYHYLVKERQDLLVKYTVFVNKRFRRSQLTGFARVAANWINLCIEAGVEPEPALIRYIAGVSHISYRTIASCVSVCVATGMVFYPTMLRDLAVACTRYGIEDSSSEQTPDKAQQSITRNAIDIRLHPNNFAAPEQAKFPATLEEIFEAGILTDKEKHVLRGLAENNTLAAIGEEMGLSKGRAGQIKIKAFRKIRTWAAEEEILAEIESRLTQEIAKLLSFDEFQRRIGRSTLFAAPETVSAAPKSVPAPVPLDPVTLDSPIRRLELALHYAGPGTKINRALKAANIITIRQLVNMTENELMGIKDIGPKSVAAIKSRLAVYRWELKEAIAVEEAVSTIPKPVSAPAPLDPVTLDSPIERLELTLYYPGLGSTANRALKAANIITIKQLVNMTEDELSDIKNIGPTSIDAIKSRLAVYGWNIIEISPEERAAQKEQKRRERLAERKIQQDEEKARLAKELAEKERQMKDRGQRLYSIRKQLGLNIEEFCFVLSPSEQGKQKFSGSMSNATFAYEPAIPLYESGDVSIPDWLLNRAKELAKAPEVAKELLAQLAQAEVQAVEVEKIIAEKKALAEKLDSLLRKLKLHYWEIGMILRPADPLHADDVREFVRGKVDIPDWVMARAEELAQASPETIEGLVKTAKREELGRYDSALETLRHKFRTAGYDQRSAELLIAQIWIEGDYICANANLACPLMDAMASKIISLKIAAENHSALRVLFELTLRSRKYDRFKLLMENVNDSVVVIEGAAVEITAIEQLEGIYYRGFNPADIPGALDKLRQDLAKDKKREKLNSKRHQELDTPIAQPQVTWSTSLDEDTREDKVIKIAYKGAFRFNAHLMFAVDGNTMRIGEIKTYGRIRDLNRGEQKEMSNWDKILLKEAVEYAKSHGITTILFAPPFAQYKLCYHPTHGSSELSSDEAWGQYSQLPYDLGFRLHVADETTFSKNYLGCFSRLRWQKTLHTRSATKKSDTASVPDQKSEDIQAQASSENSDDVLKVSADTATQAAKAADIASSGLAGALDNLPRAGFIPVDKFNKLEIIATSIANMDQRLTQGGPITSPEIAELFLNSIERKLTELEKITAQLETLKLTTDEYYRDKATEQLNKTKTHALKLQKRALWLSTQLNAELKTLNQRIKQTDKQTIDPDNKDAALKALDTINNRLPYITGRITAINTKLDVLIRDKQTALPSLDLPPIRPQRNTLREVGEAVTSHSDTQNDI